MAQVANDRNVLYAMRQVPQNMQRDARAGSCELVDLRRIGKFLFQSMRGGWLKEFTKACASIGKSPGRHLDGEAVELRPQRIFVILMIDSCTHTRSSSIWLALPGTLRGTAESATSTYLASAPAQAEIAS